MKSRMKKRILSFLAVLLFVSVAVVPALAAEETIEVNKLGSITIQLKENENSQPLKGLNFTAYKVADIAMNQGQLGYTFTAEFKDSGISLDDINAPNLADHLAAYAKDNKVAGISQSNAGDSITFSDLTLGLYLLVENGSVSGYYQTSPFLVSVPMTDSNGTAWVYDVNATPKVEPLPPSPPPGPGPDPVDPDPEHETTYLKVQKVWEKAGTNIPASVEITLLKDGEAVQTVTLNNENGWEYRWDNLDISHQWNAVEVKVSDGFEVSYRITGKTVVVTNTANSDAPIIPITLTVKKVWDDSGKDRPSSVTVQLYENGKPGEIVTLSDGNDWMYTWKDLSGSSTWDVKETYVPKGYTAYYKRSGNTITITNAVTLIKTGQLVWPIPVLASLGIVSFAAGWVLISGKRNEDEES